MSPSAFSPVDIAVTFEAEFSGVDAGWTDITEDVRTNPSPRWTWGINGTGPLDLVSGPGSLSLSLKNDRKNSAGLEGYYSPGHTNARSGFEVGIALRVKVESNYKLYTIKSITPRAGEHQDLSTDIFATDWIDLMSLTKLPELVISTDRDENEVFVLIINALPSALQPRGGNGGVSAPADSYPYVFDNASQSKETVLGLFQKLAQSAYARVFLGQDVTDGEFLTLDGRNEGRFVQESNDGRIFDADMVDLDIRYDRNRIVNVVDIATPVRRVDADSTTVLYSIDSDRPTVPAGTTLTIFLDYRDPSNEAQRVSGIAMIQPVASTDFTMNQNADGAGTDLTSDHTVTATFFASSVKLEIANTGSGNSVVTFLQGRGKGVYAYADKHTRVEDATSVAKYGERLLSFRMPWNTDANVALGFADWLLTQYKDEDAPGLTFGSMTYVANRNSTLKTLMGTVSDVSRQFGITETVTGLDHTGTTWWNPQHWTYEWIEGKSLQITITMMLHEGNQAWWRLGATASDDLGVDTKLAYF